MWRKESDIIVTLFLTFFVFSSLLSPEFPKPTHGEGKQRIVSVEDVLRDLVDVDPVLDSGHVQLPDGTLTWDHNQETTYLKNEKEMLRLVGNLPAKTILKRKGVKHYSKPRCLTVRERARLQSFPDDYNFAGSLNEKSDQIGNAVPIKLAQAVAKSVMDSYKDEA
jgi:site-specific DNA-cytosine methylase